MHKSVKNGQLKKTPPYGSFFNSTIGGVFCAVCTKWFTSLTGGISFSGIALDTTS